MFPSRRGIWLLAGDASGDAEIEDDCRVLAASLRGRKQLAGGRPGNRTLPGQFHAGGTTWERRQEGLPEVLRSMADMYAGRARAFVMLIAVVLPPVVVLFVAGTVGGTIVLMFMPLFDLLKRLT